MDPAAVRSYAGADLENAGLIVSGLWVLSALLAALFLPLDPPTEPLGGAGWAIAAAIIVASAVAGARMLRRRPLPGVDALLLLSYLGLAQVALLVWLGGGAGSEYQKLGLLWVAAACGVHPPSRALPFLVVAMPAIAAPLLYDGWSDDAAASVGSDIVLWTVVGLILLRLMTRVRSQRVQLRAEEERAQELARADALTGLGNRRAFDEAVAAEIPRAARAGSTVSVVVLDIDGFKRLNDRFGHLEGDRCLREVAEVIAETTRAADRGFRWGGDEFALLLPDSGREAAEQTAVRVAAGVMDRCSDQVGTPLTISWGAAEVERGMGPEELLALADLALMDHKRRRTVRGREEPAEPEARA